MSNYVIFTDSACDIPSAMLAEWGVKQCDITYSFAGSDKEYREKDMTAADFYQKMREGGVAKTAAVNIKTFTDAFEEEVKAGKDILYLGFSSGLSTTFNSGRMAMEELKSRYPERKLLAVDSLSAAAGFGLLLYLAVKQKEAGRELDLRLHVRGILAVQITRQGLEDLVPRESGLHGLHEHPLALLPARAEPLVPLWILVPVRIVDRNDVERLRRLGSKQARRGQSRGERPYAA